DPRDRGALIQAVAPREFPVLFRHDAIERWVCKQTRKQPHRVPRFRHIRRKVVFGTDLGKRLITDSPASRRILRPSPANRHTGLLLCSCHGSTSNYRPNRQSGVGFEPPSSRCAIWYVKNFWKNSSLFIPMFEQAFKNIDDVLWKEAGCTTELDYTEQTSWLLFLKYLDALEQDKADEAALERKKYAFILEKPYRWESWAAPRISKARSTTTTLWAAMISWIS